MTQELKDLMEFYDIIKLVDKKRKVILFAKTRTAPCCITALKDSFAKIIELKKTIFYFPCSPKSYSYKEMKEYINQCAEDDVSEETNEYGRVATQVIDFLKDYNEMIGEDFAEKCTIEPATGTLLPSNTAGKTLYEVPYEKSFLKKAYFAVESSDDGNAIIPKEYNKKGFKLYIPAESGYKIEYAQLEQLKELCEDI